MAFIKSVAEFAMSSPVLSFSIVNAAVRKYKCGNNDGFFIEEMEDYDEDNNCLYCVAIRMFIVQPKSLQECHIFYQPTLFESDTDVKSTISYINSTILSNSPQTIKGLSSHETESENNVHNHYNTVINGKSNFDQHLCNDKLEHIEKNVTISNEAKNDLSVQKRDKSVRDDTHIDNQKLVISNHSSPSREVQEILFAKDGATDISYCSGSKLTKSINNVNVYLENEKDESEVKFINDSEVKKAKFSKSNWSNEPSSMSPINVPKDCYTMCEHYQQLEKVNTKFDHVTGKNNSE